MRHLFITRSLIVLLSVLFAIPVLASAWEIPKVPKVPHVPAVATPHMPPKPPGVGGVSNSFSSFLERACEDLIPGGVGRFPIIIPGFCTEKEVPPPPPPEEEGSVAINEVMYSPDGADATHEWVEIVNGTNSPVDFSAWKFNESGGDHGLTLATSTAEVAAGGFAIIADDAEQFLLDWPLFSGTLFDSAFSLANTGETIAIKNAGGDVVDTLTYAPEQGADGDGNSLQRTPEDTWVGAVPTPGAANVTP